MVGHRGKCNVRTDKAKLTIQTFILTNNELALSGQCTLADLGLWRQLEFPLYTYNISVIGLR